MTSGTGARRALSAAEVGGDMTLLVLLDAAGRLVHAAPVMSAGEAHFGAFVAAEVRASGVDVRVEVGPVPDVAGAVARFAEQLRREAHAHPATNFFGQRWAPFSGASRARVAAVAGRRLDEPLRLSAAAFGIDDGHMLGFMLHRSQAEYDKVARPGSRSRGARREPRGQRARGGHHPVLVVTVDGDVAAGHSPMTVESSLVTSVSTS